jgi:cytidyltransferase-like protein
MIIQFDELSRYQYSVTMVDGGFDPLHQGHIEYFRQACELGLPVLCNISSDEYVQRKHPPLLSLSQRAQVIDALRYITLTHPNRFDTEAVLCELRPRYYVKGKDWEGRLPPQQLDICQRHGIEIRYLDTVRDSSSEIFQRCMPGAPMEAQVEAFAKLVFAQQAPSAGCYDEAYFTDQWRDDGNAYTLAARRVIEGRNPELIKEVFQPRRILDMGCGPGALMYLLSELGLEVDGVDLSPRSKALAPSEVRDRIMIGAVSDAVLPANAYDLVICREVFEHLTVLQVRQAVENICRISSNYVYVTTRFHPAPLSLLDVTTQLDVDPTHITLLNKNFLRILFVLHGFQRRADLEARMDWLNKGRVLVYQKHQGEHGP